MLEIQYLNYMENRVSFQVLKFAFSYMVRLKNIFGNTYLSSPKLRSPLNYLSDSVSKINHQ